MNYKTTILKAKYFKPGLPSDFIYRKRLTDKLDGVLQSSAVLISAPSGYGKTLLAASWLQHAKMPSCWISLSKSENNFNTFIRYIVLGINKLQPNFGVDLMSLLDSGNEYTPAELTEMFLNEAASYCEPVILVLDDYHHIHNEEIHKLFIELFNLPIQSIKLVFITRRDPALPLSSWRLKHKLTEVRANDLLFSPKETKQFIENYSELKELAGSQIEDVQNYTEGWISGLRMLILNLISSPDGLNLKHSIQNVSMLREVINEFLDNQSEFVKKSLLKLSLVNEFNQEIFKLLVSDDENGFLSFSQFINMLKDSNLFIINLENKGQWYRFHHLFRDMLRSLVSLEFDEYSINKLQIAIAGWYASINEYHKSIQHYQKGNSQELALLAFKKFRSNLFKLANWQQIEQLLSYFSSETIKCNNILSLTEAWVLVYKGNIPAIKELLPELEWIVENQSDTNVEKEKLLGELYALKAYIRYNFEIDMHLCLEYSQKALKQINDSNDYALGISWIFYGGAMQALGKAKEANQKLYNSISNTANQNIKSNQYLILCYITWLEGDLNHLNVLASQLIKFGKENSIKEAEANGYYFRGCSNYYRCKLDLAYEDFKMVYQLRFHTLAVHRYFGTIGFILLNLTKGKLNDVHNLLNEIEKHSIERGGAYYVEFTKSIRNIIQWETAKDFDSIKWAMQRNHLPLIPMTNLTSVPIIQAYILIASEKIEAIDKAVVILEECIEFLEKYHNKRFLAGAYYLYSIANHLKNKTKKCHHYLSQAISIASPGSVLLPFTALQQHLRSIITTMNLLPEEKAFLDAVTQSDKKVDDNEIASRLTSREQEILRLISINLLNKQIGEKLFISESTVKRHIANIYKKLNIQNRREAIAKVKELSLISE